MAFETAVEKDLALAFAQKRSFVDSVELDSSVFLLCSCPGTDADRMDWSE